MSFLEEFMKNTFLKFLFIIFSVIFFNNCSVGNFTDLWPTDAEENGEVVIREIPEESFDPEDTEEIVTVINSDEETDEITIIDEMTDSSIEDANDNEIEMSNQSIPEVDAIQTYVGDRVAEMRDEFSRLDEEIKQNSNLFSLLKANGIASAEVYHSTVAAISARLQIGTTPGNPILLNQYERALTELAAVGSQGQEMVELGNQISLLSGRVSYLRSNNVSKKITWSC